MVTTSYLFPVMVHFFQPYEGAPVKLLHIKSHQGETSEYFKEIIEKHELTGILVCFCGDNTTCHFGGARRKGVNNIIQELRGGGEETE